jgi:hypothetical protein
VAIEQVPGQSLTPAAGGPAAPGERSKAASRGPAGAGDRVQLSAFGQLVARSLTDFQDARAPRPDRVREFAERRDEPVEWTDEVLASVIRRARDA